MTSSCAPASLLYSGSERVEIWLGVRRVRRGRRGAADPVGLTPASCAAVTSRVAGVDEGAAREARYT
jgi:hypothetical protein